MLKARIYIYQLLGIIVLLCGYLLGNQPDNLSIMHFDPNPVCQSVFIKSTKDIQNKASFQATSTSQNNTSRKTNLPKFMSYETVLPPAKAFFRFHAYHNITHAFPLPENYTYLFYEEINPPPPKAC